MNVRTKKVAAAVLAGWALLTFSACLAFADMPRADRGHMGVSNTAAVGMVPVGNGTGFAEQQPTTECALQKDSVTKAFECWDGGGGDGSFAVPFPGLPVDGEILYFPLNSARTCADDFAGSVAKAKAASTGTATFTIKKNGSTVGTVVFTASATGVWATSGGATAFADGDTVEVVAPSPQNATLSSVGLTFECVKD